jgi:hypothetical protein
MAQILVLAPISSKLLELSPIGTRNDLLYNIKPYRWCTMSSRLFCFSSLGSSILIDTVGGPMSKRKSSKSRKSRFFPQPPHENAMPPRPHSPRKPLCEVSPNSRSRVVSAHDYRVRFRDIAKGKDLLYSTCRSIVKNASRQASCIT